jgi:rfaE bifunctional protein nucleotidyltransferase chain/domain
MLSKILELQDLTKVVHDLRKSGKKIVFTNGCFDILHVGHVRYLAAARSQGHVLVVGLNSDASVRSIKPENRPIVSQNQRAEVLAGLECVDYITVFNEPDPLKIIKELKPDVLVKGADWIEAEIIGADIVKANGGKVVRIPVVPEISTSRIIQRIAKRYQQEYSERCLK